MEVFAGGILSERGIPSFGAFDQVFNGAWMKTNGPMILRLLNFRLTGLTGGMPYLGGSGNEQPHSMICDAAGNLVIARSNSFQTRMRVKTIPPCYQKSALLGL